MLKMLLLFKSMFIYKINMENKEGRKHYRLCISLAAALVHNVVTQCSSFEGHGRAEIEHHLNAFDEKL